MERRGVSDEAPAVTPFEAAPGVTVHLRTLPAEHLVALSEYQRRNPGASPDFQARVIAASVVDADGNPVLSVEGARKLPAIVSERIAREIVRINGL
jgi:hypothetical protein